MNVPKMTTVDLPLFNGIVSDLFPGIEPPAIDYSRVSEWEIQFHNKFISIISIKIKFFSKFKKAIESELKEDNLQVNANAINKAIQLYETKNSRHSVMLVGRTQSGKTITWQTLKKALTRLNREGEPGYQKAQVFIYNFLIWINLFVD